MAIANCEFSIRITMLEMNDDDYGVREINTFDVHHANINYRGEGNANVVLALPLRCQVVRLPKSKRWTSIEPEHECQLPKTFYIYKYIKSISSLFGAHFTQPPTLVRVQFRNESNFINWLNDLRPSERKLASSTDLHFEYGLIYPDAAFLNASHGLATGTTYAVEIKPKQGWHIRQLPDNVLEMFDVKRDAIDKCRFCSMQFLKTNEGKIARVGDFCPLDLFSGNLPQLNKALRCLAQSPQNNFRIFKDGHLVYTEGSHRNEFDRLANEIFLAIDDQCERKTCDDFFTLLARILLQSPATASSKTTLSNDCLLDRILNLQLLAFETMPSIAQKYSNESSLFGILARDDNWPFGHLNQLGRKIDTRASSKLEIDKAFLVNTLKLTQEELYEIGATALDCSIMLTFQCRGQHNDMMEFGNIITIDGVNFIVKSSVFDLDPKLYPKHFPKYVERTKKSYAAWSQSLTNESK